mmetsp:Transcript_3932/g.7004  ORF Transcript_3932/g.7004 Transcript_3932/m.7004 type:complete len:228 (-) Transcript_3932:90-773(-)
MFFKKGKGKGKNGKVIPSKTLWVGNIPDGTSFQDLLALAKQSGDAKWADVFPKKGSGTGAVGFSSDEEALGALTTLNGAVLGGATLTAEPWEKSETPSGGGKFQKKAWSPGPQKTWKPAFQKQGWSNGNSKGKGKGKGGGGKGKASKVMPRKTVWIGNIADGVSFADLLGLAKECGKAVWADVFPKNGKGTGAVGFKTSEEATAAVGMLSGAELGGQALVCDSWEKK